MLGQGEDYVILSRNGIVQKKRILEFLGFLKEGEKMKLVAPKLSYIEKTSFEECLKKMKFQDVHIDQNIQQRTIIQDLTFDWLFF